MSYGMHIWRHTGVYDWRRHAMTSWLAVWPRAQMFSWRHTKLYLPLDGICRLCELVVLSRNISTLYYLDGWMVCVFLLVRQCFLAIWNYRISLLLNNFRWPCSQGKLEGPRPPLSGSVRLKIPTLVLNSQNFLCLWRDDYAITLFYPICLDWRNRCLSN